MNVFDVLMVCALLAVVSGIVLIVGAFAGALVAVGAGLVAGGVALGFMAILATVAESP